MTDRIELKPCPFCGGKAKLNDEIIITPVIDENGAYVDADIDTPPEWVECTICGATGEVFDNGDESDAEKAVEAWNQRSNEK